jgi:hypothetical protein
MLTHNDSTQNVSTSLITTPQYLLLALCIGDVVITTTATDLGRGSDVAVLVTRGSGGRCSPRCGQVTGGVALFVGAPRVAGESIAAARAGHVLAATRLRRLAA